MTTKTGKGLTKKKAESAELGSAFIPPKHYYTSYISRKFAGTSEFDIFETSLAENYNVLIEGPTGPGKTSAVLAFAAKTKRPFYSVSSNVGIEPSQLFGKYIPNGEGGFEWIDGPVTTLVRNGGVLLLNEFNFLPARVATVLFGLLDKRREIQLLDHKAEVIKAHEDLLVIADMNPDYAGTQTLNVALRNRFAVQLFWDYDPNIEKQLLNSKTLLEVARKLRADFQKGALITPVSTNMLMEFERITGSFGLDFAIQNFVTHFEPDARDAVKMTMDTVKMNLDRELYIEPEPEEAEATSKYPLDHPIWIERGNAEDGWVDPEWGVKGDDWIWES